MRIPRLAVSSVKLIHAAVDLLFAKARGRILGAGHGLDMKLIFGFNKFFSLPGIFNSASREEDVVPNDDILKTLISNVDSYIDSYKSETKAQVVKAVDSWMKNAHISGVKTDINTVLGGELAGVFGKVTTDMKRLIDTESNQAKNLGTLDGILRVNAIHRVQDPVVYFIVVRDRSLCKECKRLHLMPDGITPRLWYTSEVGHGYHKKGEQNPKLSGVHPNCRCGLSTLLPGYAFDKSGSVTFHSLDHDAIKEQRS